MGRTQTGGDAVLQLDEVYREYAGYVYRYLCALTAAQADALLGRSVKEAGQTPSGVQELLDSLRTLSERDLLADRMPQE